MDILLEGHVSCDQYSLGKNQIQQLGLYPVMSIAWVKWRKRISTYLEENENLSFHKLVWLIF